MFASRKRPAAAYEDVANHVYQQQLSKRSNWNARQESSRSMPTVGPVIVEGPPRTSESPDAPNAFAALATASKDGAPFRLGSVSFLSRGSFGYVYKVVICGDAKDHAFAVKVCIGGGSAARDEVELATLISRLAHKDRCASAGFRGTPWMPSRAPACPWVVQTYGAIGLSAELISELRVATSPPEPDFGSSTCEGIVMEFVSYRSCATSAPSTTYSYISDTRRVQADHAAESTTLQAWVAQLQGSPALVATVAQLVAQVMFTFAFCSNTLGLLMNDAKLDNVLVKTSRCHRMVVCNRVGDPNDTRILHNAHPISACMIDFSLSVAYGSGRVTTGAEFEKLHRENKRIMSEMCVDVAGVRTRGRGTPTFTDHVCFMLNLRRALKNRQSSLSATAGAGRDYVCDCVSALDRACLDLCGGQEGVADAVFVDLIDSGFRPARWFWTWLHDRGDEEFIIDYVVVIPQGAAPLWAGGDTDRKPVHIGLRAALDLELTWVNQLPRRLDNWVQSIILRTAIVIHAEYARVKDSWEKKGSRTLHDVVVVDLKKDATEFQAACNRSNIPIHALPSYDQVRRTREGLVDFAARFGTLEQGVDIEAAAEGLRKQGLDLRAVRISRNRLILHAQDFLTRAPLFDVLQTCPANFDTRLADVVLNGIEREVERVRLISLVDCLQTTRGRSELDDAHLRDVVSRFESRGFANGVCMLTRDRVAAAATQQRAATLLQFAGLELADLGQDRAAGETDV